MQDGMINAPDGKTAHKQPLLKRIVLLFLLMVFVLTLHLVADAAQGTGTAELRPVHPWRPMPKPDSGSVAQSAPAEAPPVLSPTVWTPIGPAPLSITATPNVNFNVSGRLAGLATDPANTNIIYVAAAGGGVWRTTNGGTTWLPLTDNQATLSMGAIAVAPSNASMIYAGTGEANNSGDSNYGRGVLVSTDGGATWTLRTAGGAFDRKTISEIAVDPTNANVAYIAVAGGGVHGLSGNTGVWKTTDGGATWTNTTTAITSTQPWSSVSIDPNTPTTLYAAVGNAFGASQNGAYKSINGGTSWSVLSGAPAGTTAGRIVIAVAKANSQVVYVSATSSSNFGALYKFMRSDNGGSTWTDLTAGTPNYLGGQGWYDTALIVDPTNAAIVYAAGSAGTNSMLRSTNSGLTWTDIHAGGAPTFSSPHVDHHAFAFDASGRLLDGDDGGIWRLDNPAVPSWTDLNGNLQTIQFQGIGLHPTNANIAIGGSQDNGTEVYSGSIIWTETDGGDGGFAKFSQTNGMRAYHQIPVASFGTNFFRRSDDGGQSWTTRTSGISVDANVQNFYAPFVVDPGNGDRVLYGTNRVWETTDGGNTWTTISNVNTAGFNNGGNNVNAIGLAPSNANTVYATTGSSQIFVTVNHGAAWTGINLPVTGRVNDIQVDPANAQIAYVTINTFNGANGQVYKTINGGTTWTNITGNLPAIPVWSLQIDPTAHRLFVGADDGVYVTTNGGTTWSRFETGLPNAQVLQIELNTTLHILGAGIHGRGMWEILLTAPIVADRDFNGDGRSDILWRNTSGTLSEWLLNGTNVIGQGSPGGASTDWAIVGAGCTPPCYPLHPMGDFNGDGTTDLLWRHTSGLVYEWLLNGTNVIDQGSPGSASTDWQIVGVGDFNGDGKADILWRHISGGVYIWFMDGINVIGQGSPGGAGIDWTIVDVGDFNGDGKADILWQHTSGLIYEWLMNGTNVIGQGSPGSASTDWQIVGVGDFNGDGKSDLLWRHISGSLYTWFLDGSSVIDQGSPGSLSTDWTVVGVGDYNGDHNADILWRHTSGLVYEWLLNGTTVIDQGSPGSASTDWTIQ